MCENADYSAAVLIEFREEGQDLVHLWRWSRSVRELW